MSEQPATHWLERPRTIRRLWIGFAAALVAMLAVELFVSVHGHFGIDGSFAFHAWYGFLGCAALVLIARLLGAILKRADTYYDPWR